MDSQGNNAVTQVSIRGFRESTAAKDLSDYLTRLGLAVLRCRVKTSLTPPGSFPNFEVSDTSVIPTIMEKAKPHAFVHFVEPNSARLAKMYAQRKRLLLDNQLLEVRLKFDNPYSLNRRSRTTPPIKFAGVSVEIGTLVSPDKFLVSWRAEGVDFLVDSFDHTCRFCFQKSTAFAFKDTVMQAVVNCDFKLEFSVRNIQTVSQYRYLDELCLLLQLDSSPLVSYRTAADDVYETPSHVEFFDDGDPWIRTTDCTRNRAIGRCLSYRVLIPGDDKIMIEVLNYLKMQSVREEVVVSHPKISEEPDFGKRLSDPFFCIHDKEGIPFDTMFLVNSVLHMGILNQYQLTDPFFDLLKNQHRDVNIASLKHLCSYKQPIIDAYKKLKHVQEWILKNPMLLGCYEQSDNFSEIRRLLITPTRAYCLPPEVELSNRVLREYKAVSGRFLRVTFMDESMQTLNSTVLSYHVDSIVRDVTTSPLSQNTHIFERVNTILRNGFKLCGRKYSFLAFSSGQLKDCSAWYFAEDNETRVSDIKKWMGRFHDKNVAKCSARMGQCFSSTYASVDVKPHEVDTELPDIKRNGYVFSDGIGTITPVLADEVMEKLKLDLNSTPCAYQIRYAGFKGVVARWPSTGDRIRLALRPSMNKFDSKHTILEICSWTRFQPCFLNRQIITLLSTLGVPDKVFLEMQETMLCNLKNQMWHLKFSQNHVMNKVILQLSC